MHALTPIREVMTPNPITIDAELPLADARARMSNERVRHLAVVRDAQLVGILSARDVMLFEDFHALASEEVTVEAAMTANPISVEPNATLASVLETMLIRDIGAVLVKDGEALAGILTHADTVRLLRDVLARG